MYFNQHKIGLFLITCSFVFLIYKQLRGVKMMIPSTFLFIYGLGGLILMNHMYWHAISPKISIMEMIGAVCSLYLGVIMYKKGC